MKKLTEKEYWDKYWKNGILPRYRNMNTISMKLVDKLLKKKIKTGKGKTLLEIGCAPGSWLIYFKKTFGFDVYGMDYIQSGIDYTKRNLKYAGVKASGLYTQDIFNNKMRRKFDVVFSWGLLEHFTDQELIVKKHYELVKKGGLLIIFVPNFQQGINRIIQGLVNKKILDAHYKITRQDMKRIYEEIGLKDVEAEYIGYFDPAIFNPGTVLGVDKHKFFKVHNIAMKNSTRILKRLPYFESKMFSSFVYGIGRK